MTEHKQHNIYGACWPVCASYSLSILRVWAVFRRAGVMTTMMIIVIMIIIAIVQYACAAVVMCVKDVEEEKHI